MWLAINLSQRPYVIQTIFSSSSNCHAFQQHEPHCLQILSFHPSPDNCESNCYPPVNKASHIVNLNFVDERTDVDVVYLDFRNTFETFRCGYDLPVQQNYLVFLVLFYKTFRVFYQCSLCAFLNI